MAATQTNGQAAPEIKDAAALLRASGEQFGQNLPENVEVVVHGWTTSQQNFDATVDRPARTATQINLDLTIMPDSDPANATDYHCFSAVLLRQLNAIGVANLPFKAVFVRRPTQDGRVDAQGRRFQSWSIKTD